MQGADAKSRLGNVASRVWIGGPRRTESPGPDAQLRIRPGDDSRYVGAAATSALTQTSHLLQRLRQILDQIVRMFQPRGEANESVADAEFGARLRRQALMGRGGRMRDEAL